jgi:signal transduction histidine kinase
MNKAKTIKLSWLLGLYLLFSIIGISFSLLAWTYHNAMQVIDKELQGAFKQRHTIAEIILEYQIEIVHRQLQNISKNEQLTAQILKSDQIEAKKILYKILDANHEYPLDIAFISLSKDLIWLDANDPFFAVSPILPDIIDRQRDLLSSGHILRFQKEFVDLTMMLKAAPVIHNRTGKVLGTLFGGIVLNNNLSILENIQKNTQASVIVLLENGEIIGSTDLLSAQSTRTLQDARDHRDSGQIYSANHLLVSYNKISLSGRPTSVEIAMAIPDQSLHALQNAYLQQGIILLLVCLVFLSMTYFSLRRLIQPSLKKLLNYSASVSSGNLQARYQAGTVTEFNQFGRAAERMVETIRMEIEERRQAELALQILNTELDQRVTQRTAQLEAANQAKSSFLANMSHELRTPLNAILGFAQLIFRNPSIPEEHKEHIELINRSGEHLLVLINQVLDMSKIEAGRATFEASTFDLG